MEKARFLLSVVFRLHKLNTYEWVGYVVQEKHCHCSELIEVDEENLGDLSKLVDNKLKSMSQELNVALEGGDVRLGSGRKLPSVTYLPSSHSLVKI